MDHLDFSPWSYAQIQLDFRGAPFSYKRVILCMRFNKGFYSISLIIIAFIVWLIWEICVIIYPERFSEETNKALKCSECTDKLCTQYCKKRQT